MKRLFIAIPNTLKALEDLEQSTGSFVRWTKPRKLHITVYFCGDVKESLVPKLNKKLEQALVQVEPFQLELEKIIFAPPGKPPRMIWAKFKENVQYTDLVNKVYNAIKEYLYPEFAQKPHKNPIPHMTIARFREPSIAKEINLQQVEIEPMMVKSCQLMESELNSEGSIYTELYNYALK